MILSSSALAQEQERTTEPVALALDSPVEGSLSTDDAKIGDSFYDSYMIRLALGQSVQIDMASEELDSFLDIVSPGLSDPFMSDDDGSGSLDARLRFLAPVAGDYLVRARSLNGGTGSYTLAVKPVTAPAKPPAPLPIAAGADIGGSLSSASPRLDDDSPYALYRFRAKAGSRISVDMKAISSDGESSLDPRLSVRSADDGAGFSATDDDGGGGTDARIVAIAPSSGDYIISALGWPGNEGDYSLRLEQFAPARPAPPEPLVLDRPAEGRLSLDDPSLQLGAGDDGAASYVYRLYTFRAQGGDEIVIELKSSDFDPVLEAGVMSPIGFAVAQTNDDFSGTDARLVLTPDAPGVIHIRARSLGLSDLGDGGYTISVSAGR